MMRVNKNRANLLSFAEREHHHTSFTSAKVRLNQSKLHNQIIGINTNFTESYFLSYYDFSRSEQKSKKFWHFARLIVPLPHKNYNYETIS